VSEQSAVRSGWSFGLPGNAHEIAALLLAVFIVFVLIQFGAPIIRDIEFLDPKLRDYFIGISFVAFPAIHRGCKRGLASFAPQQTVARHDLAPWFVTGVIAAALLFAWNQFVSFLGGVSSGLTLGQLGVQNNDPQAVASAVMVGIIVVSLPLSAVAAVFAGISLNRHTRSHTFWALALASLSFVAFNAGTNWLFEPEFVAAQFNEAAAAGALGIAMFFVGLALVGVIIFVFGAVGVFISRFKREHSIGRLMEAARGLSPSERDRLAAEISGHVTANAGASQPGAGFVAQMPSAAEP
jgi:hypothetical protein